MLVFTQKPSIIQISLSKQWRFWANYDWLQTFTFYLHNINIKIPSFDLDELWKIIKKRIRPFGPNQSKIPFFLILSSSQQVLINVYAFCIR